MKLDPAVMMVETEYGWVLLDETAGAYYSLNPTGVVALQALLDGADLETAITRITTQYDVDAETARSDVEDLLRQLDQAKLVTR
jgi:hypothetical protein